MLFHTKVRNNTNGDNHQMGAKISVERKADEIIVPTSEPSMSQRTSFK